MKVIVVSGARSDVGKTHLARNLCSLLPGAERVKIGEHERKPGGYTGYYSLGTTFSTIVADHPDARFLIIESNRILNDITPDLAIYLPAPGAKPSAAVAIEKADIIRGQTFSDEQVPILARRLECEETVIRAIVELADSTIGAIPKQ
jgi:hypothetical protein